MSNPAQAAAQIRFAMAQLPAHNAHHTFEDICRHLTRQSICSNVLPATGPVSAGGDQGRDFETFRTYLREELGWYGAFLGLVSKGVVAFICTTQAKGIRSKILADIAKVVDSGHAVHEIKAFCLSSVGAATRHKLESEARQKHQVTLEIIDAEAIAELLATPQAFWIAEQFLALPAELRPSAPVAHDESPSWYVDLREKWRAKGAPGATLGDLIDLKDGLREATFYKEARSDLPFWLGLTREILANKGLSSATRQRARYELVVATLRGLRDLRPVDGVVNGYLAEALVETEPSRLLDASILLLYVNGAAQRGLTALNVAEIMGWNSALRDRVQHLISSATPNKRAALLFALGHLGLHPALQRVKIPAAPEDLPDVADWNGVDSPLAADGVPANVSEVFADLKLTMTAWTELATHLEQAPLFPIDVLSSQIQLLTPVLISQPGWRKLVDLVDEAVARVSGKSAVAELARNRAMALLHANRRLDALTELHQAKIDWWSGDTMRGSLVAMLTISQLYLELRLPTAAKANALAVTYVAGGSADDELADLIPVGLLMAAHADFTAGAWCGAVELFEIGLQAQHHFIEDGLDIEKHQSVQQALLDLAYITTCARELIPSLAARFIVVMGHLGIMEFLEGLAAEGPLYSGSWAEFAGDAMTGNPFSDLGVTRAIRFSALGTDWTITSANDPRSVHAAERFAAAAQVLLAELAKDDLCIAPTRITVNVETTIGRPAQRSETVEPLPSNDGRFWGVRLTSATDPQDIDPGEVQIELVSALTCILLEACLLPQEEFLAIIEGAFERGLSGKLSAPRPYDELAAIVSDQRYAETGRDTYSSPLDLTGPHRSPHPDLAWQDRVGPTFARERSDEMLRNRYATFSRALQKTVPALRLSPQFREVVKGLRAQGWRDWHLLTAIVNIALNHRQQFTAHDLQRPGAREEIPRAAFGPETDASSGVPVEAFTADAMDEARRAAMVSLLHHWGLASHQRTPDFPAIERLLAKRYGYWSDDIEHDDPFPEAVLPQ